MTFFDWFMAAIGFVCFIAIVFGLVCKIFPSVLDNELVFSIYVFMLGYEAEDLYEIE